MTMMTKLLFLGLLAPMINANDTWESVARKFEYDLWERRLAAGGACDKKDGTAKEATKCTCGILAQEPNKYCSTDTIPSQSTDTAACPKQDGAAKTTETCVCGLLPAGLKCETDMYCYGTAGACTHQDAKLCDGAKADGAKLDSATANCWCSNNYAPKSSSCVSAKLKAWKADTSTNMGLVMQDKDSFFYEARNHKLGIMGATNDGVTKLCVKTTGAADAVNVANDCLCGNVVCTMGQTCKKVEKKDMSTTDFDQSRYGWEPLVGDAKGETYMCYGYTPPRNDGHAKTVFLEKTFNVKDSDMKAESPINCASADGTTKATVACICGIAKNMCKKDEYCEEKNHRCMSNPTCKGVDGTSKADSACQCGEKTCKKDEYCRLDDPTKTESKILSGICYPTPMCSTTQAATTATPNGCSCGYQGPPARFDIKALIAKTLAPKDKLEITDPFELCQKDTYCYHEIGKCTNLPVCANMDGNVLTGKGGCSCPQTSDPTANVKQSSAFFATCEQNSYCYVVPKMQGKTCTKIKRCTSFDGKDQNALAKCMCHDREVENGKYCWFDGQTARSIGAPRCKSTKGYIKASTQGCHCGTSGAGVICKENQYCVEQANGDGKCNVDQSICPDTQGFVLLSKAKVNPLAATEETCLCQKAPATDNSTPCSHNQYCKVDSTTGKGTCEVKPATCTEGIQLALAENGVCKCGADDSKQCSNGDKCVKDNTDYGTKHQCHPMECSNGDGTAPWKDAQNRKCMCGNPDNSKVKTHCSVGQYCLKGQSSGVCMDHPVMCPSRNGMVKYSGNGRCMCGGRSTRAVGTTSSTPIHGVDGTGVLCKSGQFCNAFDLAGKPYNTFDGGAYCSNEVTARCKFISGYEKEEAIAASNNAEAAKCVCGENGPICDKSNPYCLSVKGAKGTCAASLPDCTVVEDIATVSTDAYGLGRGLGYHGAILSCRCAPRKKDGKVGHSCKSDADPVESTAECDKADDSRRLAAGDRRLGAGAYKIAAKVLDDKAKACIVKEAAGPIKGVRDVCVKGEFQITFDTGKSAIKGPGRCAVLKECDGVDTKANTGVVAATKSCFCVNKEKPDLAEFICRKGQYCKHEADKAGKCYDLPQKDCASTDGSTVAANDCRCGKTTLGNLSTDNPLPEQDPQGVKACSKGEFCLINTSGVGTCLTAVVSCDGSGYRKAKAKCLCGSTTVDNTKYCDQSTVLSEPKKCPTTALKDTGLLQHGHFDELACKCGSGTTCKKGQTCDNTGTGKCTTQLCNEMVNTYVGASTPQDFQTWNDPNDCLCQNNPCKMGQACIPQTQGATATCYNVQCPNEDGSEKTSRACRCGDTPCKAGEYCTLMQGKGVCLKEVVDCVETDGTRPNAVKGKCKCKGNKECDVGGLKELYCDKVNSLCLQQPVQCWSLVGTKTTTIDTERLYDSSTISDRQVPLVSTDTIKNRFSAIETKGLLPLGITMTGKCTCGEGGEVCTQEQKKISRTNANTGAIEQYTNADFGRLKFCVPQIKKCGFHATCSNTEGGVRVETPNFFQLKTETNKWSGHTSQCQCLQTVCNENDYCIGSDIDAAPDSAQAKQWPGLCQQRPITCKTRDGSKPSHVKLGQCYCKPDDPKITGENCNAKVNQQWCLPNGACKPAPGTWALQVINGEETTKRYPNITATGPDTFKLTGKINADQALIHILVLQDKDAKPTNVQIGLNSHYNNGKASSDQKAWKGIYAKHYGRMRYNCSLSNSVEKPKTCDVEVKAKIDRTTYDMNTNDARLDVEGETRLRMEVGHTYRVYYALESADGVLEYNTDTNGTEIVTSKLVTLQTPTNYQPVDDAKNMETLNAKQAEVYLEVKEAAASILAKIPAEFGVTFIDLNSLKIEDIGTSTRQPKITIPIVFADLNLDTIPAEKKARLAETSRQAIADSFPKIFADPTTGFTKDSISITMKRGSIIVEGTWGGDDGLSTAAIIAIVFGALVLASLVIAGGVMICKRRKAAPAAGADGVVP